ncbi:hypothetical protein DKK70_11255 [Gilliamella apicola]|uniref:Uncharacterized protein n=1 Tax=Gilliamella apicola TaxID=1196095 RepID=A0A2V4E1V5_9GAMM|nr:hypothetical protein [Gilliamella apicola]PXZ06533.1 hypothetical protein DKK70_11255 [Gilliamella apicola]
MALFYNSLGHKCEQIDCLTAVAVKRLMTKQPNSNTRLIGIVKARIPNWAGDTMKGKLEPFAMAYPEYGLGGSAATTCKLYVD